VTFDIIEVTDEDLKKYSVVQMQLLRNAQKQKNKMLHTLENEKELFFKLYLTNDMGGSSLYENKRAALDAEYNYQLDIIVEQLLYSIQLNSPYPDDGSGDPENVGYIVDYSLSYFERYNIVRAYYMSIEDPAERMEIYKADVVAQKYLGSYYAILFDVLASYTK